ncbi:MAG: peptide ABC transporter permease, partial [Thermodesulfatator sp.]
MEQAVTQAKKKGKAASFLLALLDNPLAFSGSLIVACLFFIAVLAPLIAPYDPQAIDTW